MIFPAVTATYAALLALVYAGLSGWVVAGRLTGDVLHGDGGQGSLQKRIRSHGNFAEYVPFVLLLCALLEARGTAHWVIHALLIALLVARIAHPVGMLAPKNSVQQYACRGVGAVTTVSVLAISAILLLV